MCIRDSDYELPLSNSDVRVKLHLDANYAQATQSFDQFETKADSSFIVNSRLSVLDVNVGGRSKMNIGLWSRNLLNEQHVYRRDPSNSLPAVQTSPVTGVANVLLVGNVGNMLGDYGNFNMPRTFGLDASISF
jgi:iron complex outermembrane receptor protein